MRWLLVLVLLALGCGHQGWVRSHPCTHGLGQFLTLRDADSGPTLPNEPAIIRITVHNAVSYDDTLSLVCDGVTTKVEAKTFEDVTIPIEASRPPPGALPGKLSCELRPANAGLR